MKTPVFALLSFLSLLTVLSDAETIVSVDTESRVISLNTGTGFKAYRLADKADIRLGNAVVALEKLEPGMYATFGLVDSQTINRIVAGPPPQPGAFVPAGKPAERVISLKMRIDGTDVVKVKNGILWVEHKGWQFPLDFSVNGHAWKPKWLEEKSNEFIGFNSPLAPFNDAKVSVTKTKGRGKARVTQQPSAENNQTLAVEFDDGTFGGSDVYEAKVTW